MHEGFAHPERNVEYLHLKSGSIVADLGAGSGHYALAIGKAFKEMGGNGVVYAIDVQKSLLERLKQEADRRGLHNVQVLWGDVDLAGGTKLSDNLCDIVVVSNVLLQSSTKEAFMREAARILKPGGEMMIIDWHQHLPQQEIIDLAPRAGLRVVKKFDAGSHHWGLLLKK